MAVDQAVTLECLALTGTPRLESTAPRLESTAPLRPPPLTTEYTWVQLDSARANLEVLAKHTREYMADQVEWEVFNPPANQSAHPQQMSTTVSKMNVVGIPVIQAMASLLRATLEQTDDLKKSSASTVLHMWPSH